MTDLSRSLLAAAREGLNPDAATTARVRARVASAVAPTAAAGTAAGSSGALLKLAALALVAGVIMTGFAIPRGPHADAPRLSLHTADTDEPVAQIAPMASRESAMPHVSRHPATVREPASLAREVELIDDAMDALRNGSPTSALERLATFERETLGQAQLAEDAAAIDLEARCALREDVSAKLAAFDTKWPTSAQRVRISAACR